jgi:hypothetical protein
MDKSHTESSAFSFIKQTYHYFIMLLIYNLIFFGGMLCIKAVKGISDFLSNNPYI